MIANAVYVLVGRKVNRTLLRHKSRVFIYILELLVQNNAELVEDQRVCVAHRQRLLQKL